MTLFSLRPMALLKELHGDESGMDTIEKIILMGAIAVPLATIIFLFGQDIKNIFSGSASTMVGKGTIK